MAKRTREGVGAALKRTVRLLSALLAGVPIDAKRAAKILNVNEPAARSQLRALQEIEGVHASKVSGRLEWTFSSPPGTWPLPSIVAACFGASLAPLLEPSNYGGLLQGVRTKIISVSGKRARFPNIDRKFWFVSQGGDAPVEGNEPILDELLDALLGERLVELTYVNFEGVEKTGIFAPLSLVVYQHQLYLVARHEDQSLRNLRLSRIRKVECKTSFEYPPPDTFDPRTVFASSFGVWLDGQKATQITVRLDPAWATHARTHRWHASQEVRVETDAVFVTIRCRLSPEVEQWAMSFGESAVVIEPLTLRQKIADRARRMAERYA